MIDQEANLFWVTLILGTAISVVLLYFVVFYAVRNAIKAARPEVPVATPAPSHIDADGL